MSISDILKESSVSANKTSSQNSELDAAIQKAKQNKSLFESESEKQKEAELKREKDRVAELENKVKEIEEKAQADKRETAALIK